MIGRIGFKRTIWLILGLLLLTTPSTSAQTAPERLCDPSFENCYWELRDLVNAETVGIDMAFYMIDFRNLRT